MVNYTLVESNGNYVLQLDSYTTLTLLVGPHADSVKYDPSPGNISPRLIDINVMAGNRLLDGDDLELFNLARTFGVDQTPAEQSGLFGRLIQLRMSERFAVQERKIPHLSLEERA